MGRGQATQALWEKGRADCPRLHPAQERHCAKPCQKGGEELKEAEDSNATFLSRSRAFHCAAEGLLSGGSGWQTL